MKQRLWLTLVTSLAYCVDKELWKANDYLKEQVRVLQEPQEKDKRIVLNNCQRIRLAAKAKRLTRRLLEETTVLFTPDTILGRDFGVNTLKSLALAPDEFMYPTGLPVDWPLTVASL